MRLPKNLFNNMYEKPKIFLCETDKQKMGILNTTDTHVSLKFNTYSELTFNIDRTYIDTLTGQKKTHLFYDRIEHPRLILLDNIGYFQIQAPDMSTDSFKESKAITAYSSEYALSQKYITNLHINTGEVDSVEVIYSEETGRALEPVTFYNQDNPRLSLLHLALEDVYGWKIGHVDDSLKTLARSFDIDRQSVYDFLMNDVCEKCNCYIVFDTLKNEINVYAESKTAKFIGDGWTKTFTISPPFHKIDTVSIDGYKTTKWEYDKKTGILTLEDRPKNGSSIEVVDGGLTEWETDVFLTFENLASEMQVSYDADDIKTRLTVTYGDDLDIREINMGSPYITDLSYYYTVDWMGQDLYDSYTEYLKKSQESQTQYTKNSQEMLENSDYQYFQEHRLSMAYSQVAVDNNTIGTYYLRDYSNGGYFFKEVTLPDDYSAYATYYQFDGVKLTSEKVSDLYMAIRDNFKTGSIEKINEISDAFAFMNDKYYNIEYLSTYLNNSNKPQNKKSYVMNFLKEMWEQIGRTPLKSVYQETFKVLQSTNIDWAQEHIDPDGNSTYHENYPWYYAILLFLESIDIAIADRDTKINTAQKTYDELQAKNIAISNDLLMENNFTEAQLIRLSAFIKEDELHIDDIIETEYDTLEDSFKVKQDAMEAGRIELHKRCQPQLQFSATMANIYAIPEFEPIIHQFQLGKVIKIGIRSETKVVEFIGDGSRKQFVIAPPFYNVKAVSIDDAETTYWKYNKATGILELTYWSAPKNGARIKVVGENNYIKQSRLLQVDMGLDDLSDFQAQFGELTSIRSQSDIHADLLSQAIQAGKSVASSQDNWNAGVDKAISTDLKIQQGLLDATTTLKSIDGDQGVEIGKYGIKLQKVNPDTSEVDPKQGWITNNMMAYTDNNWLSSKSVFGEYTIKGESSPRWGLLADACIASYIEGSTLVGGRIEIGKGENGAPNFSVDYDGNMIAQSADIVGKITADEGAIRGDLDISGSLRHKNGNYTVLLRGVQDDLKKSVFHIEEKSNNTIKYPFQLNGDGSFYATKATITGKITTEDITATGGTIGGFTITNSYIAKTKKDYNDTSTGVYIGTDGIGLGANKFHVTANGKLTAEDATIKGKITTSDITATGGTIGGFDITSSYLAKTKKTYNDSNDGVYIGTTGIGLGQGKFYVTSAGKLTAADATITGKITSTEGSIGGWTIGQNMISGKNGVYEARMSKSGIGVSGNVVFGVYDGSKWSAYIDGVGKLYASNADITGKITSSDADIKGKIVASSGEIGGCKITGGTLYVDNLNIKGVNVSKLTSGTCSANTTYTGSSTYTGGLTAGYGGTYADIQGHIVAKSGEIGGCKIEGNHLWIDSAHIKSIDSNKINGVGCSWQNVTVITGREMTWDYVGLENANVVCNLKSTSYYKTLYLLVGVKNSWSSGD